MLKRVAVALFAVLLLVVSAFIPNASAEGFSYTEKTIKINFEGYIDQNTVLYDEDTEQILAPIDWIRYYGLMECDTDGDELKFYYPSQETPDDYSKVIFVNRDDASYNITLFKDLNAELKRLNKKYDFIQGAISDLDKITPEFCVSIKQKLYEQWNYYEAEKKKEIESTEAKQYISINKGEFSESEWYDNKLWVPIEELLPLFNADVGISDDGTVLISPIYYTLSQMLNDVNIEDCLFDSGDYEATGFISGTGYVIDTLLDFRLDRLYIFDTGIAEKNDYETIFKGFLKDDTDYLKTFEGSEYLLLEQRNRKNNLLEGTNTVLDNSSAMVSIDELMSLKSNLNPNISGLFKNVDTFSTSNALNVLQGFMKYVDYNVTYCNQIDDHRYMLGSVYNINNPKTPGDKAAKSITKLYGDDVADALSEALIEGSQDLINEAFSVGFDAVFPMTRVLKLTVDVANNIKDFKQAATTMNDAALLELYDSIINKAYKQYCSHMFSGYYDKDTLNEMRLCLMMALVASKHMYQTDMFRNDDKVAAINKNLFKVYLSADGYEHESSDYYGDTHKTLKSRLPKLKTAIERATKALNATYTSESGKYRIVFKSDYTCVWHQDGTFFMGTYDYNGNGYTLDVVGSGIYMSATFNAVIDGDDLIITGGVVDGERFVLSSQSNAIRVLNGTYVSESGKYKIVFSKNLTCKWYQDGKTFNGTYSYDGKVFNLDIVGSGLHQSSSFEARLDGGDLIITGGVVYGERFVKS